MMMIALASAWQGRHVEDEGSQMEKARRELSGVGDGFRTRDFRIHNPALYP